MFREIGRELLTRFLESRAGKLGVERMHVRVLPGDGERRVQIRLSIFSESPGPTHVALDLADCPLRFEGAQTSDGAPIHVSARRTLALLAFGEQLRETGAQICTDWRWPVAGPSSLHALVCPDHLPRVLAVTEPRPAPIIDVELSDDFAVASIPSYTSPDNLAKGDSVLQAAVVPAIATRTAHLDGGSRVLLHSALAERVGSAGASFTFEEISRILAYLHDLFRTSFSVSLLLIDRSDFSRGELPTGCVVAVNPADFVRHRRDWVSSSFMLARSLASIWWGHGVQFAGYRARELEYALCGAAALMWIQHSEGERAVGPLLDWLRLTARRSSVSDWLSAAQGYLAAANTAKRTLALFDCLTSESRAAGDLARLSRSGWGAILPQDAFAKSVWN